MIETENGALYTGITTDLERRYAEHLSGKKGAKFFRANKPKKIVFKEEHPTRSSATKREIAIKALSRSAKLKLKNTH